MIDSMFKRVIAYLIDMMLVSIVVSSIISSKIVNFQLEDYQNLYSEYEEMYTLYVEQINNKIDSCEDLDSAINDKKLTEEKYVSGYNNLKESYNKEEVSEDEYNNKCLAIIKDYNSNKISDEYYAEKVVHYNYLLEKNSIVSYIVSIVVCLLYFVFFQGFTGGQTLGKKITRLKVVSTKGEEKITYKQLFIRTLFLPVNTIFQNIIYSIFMLISILFIKENLFIQVTEFLYFINYIVSLGIVFTISFNKGKVGLHDIIAHTRIMEMDFKGNEIKKDKKSKKDEVEAKKVKKVSKSKVDIIKDKINKK